MTQINLTYHGFTGTGPYDTARLKMKTVNLRTALGSAQFLLSAIQDAHKDAANAENQFAELAISDIIPAVVKLESQLQRLVLASGCDPVTLPHRSVEPDCATASDE